MAYKALYNNMASLYLPLISAVQKHWPCFSYLKTLGWQRLRFVYYCFFVPGTMPCLTHTSVMNE